MNTYKGSCTASKDRATFSISSEDLIKVVEDCANKNAFTVLDGDTKYTFEDFVWTHIQIAFGPEPLYVPTYWFTLYLEYKK